MMKHILVVAMSVFGIFLNGCAMMSEFKNPEQYRSSNKETVSPKPAPISISRASYEGDFPEIIKTKCKNKVDEKCSKLLLDTLFARLDLAFPAADWKWANTWCRAEPIKCDFGKWQGAEEFEYKLRETHEVNVANARQRHQEAERAAQEAQTLQYLNAFAQGFNSAQPKRINCTTSKAGAFANTNCISSP